MDEDGNSLYPSPCYVVVTYRMQLADRALTIANGNKAVNTFAPNIVVDDTEIPVGDDDPPSVVVYTTGLSQKKVDEHSNGLEGAFFKLAKGKFSWICVKAAPQGRCQPSG